MKFNKWTVVLAAAGMVTLPSLVQAVPNMIQTAAESTTLSGYVDTTAQWNPGNTADLPHYSFGGPSKADGFNLNVVDLALDKPLDETPWAAGYHAELWFGPDANAMNMTTGFGNNTSDFAIKSAYVTLRTPIGNGIDWKMGVFDSVLGYEASNSINNPNHTRSYGYTIEPSQLTGLIGAYKFCDMVSVTAGVVNTILPTINSRNPNEATKGYTAAITLTAPKSWGWMADSTFTGGIINGWAADSGSGSATLLYAGATIATPVKGLKVGAAFDYRNAHDVGPGHGDTWVGGLYASFQATEKLSLHIRGEYIEDGDELGFNNGSVTGTFKGSEITFTAQYDLWKNVLSRAEVRWDHSNQPNYGVNSVDRSAVELLLDVAYKF